jgi:hypothetical protein
VGLGVGLDGCGKSGPIGVRTPDRPNPSEWLYRLSYPGRFVDFKNYQNMNELFGRQPVALQLTLNANIRLLPDRQGSVLH